MYDAPPPSFQPLAGVRVLSLALNLPGPAALMRCRAMGAECLKFEPPAGDPMRHYNTTAYAALHAGVEVRTVDLKQADGQALVAEYQGRLQLVHGRFGDLDA
ncbi:MAG: CoA transferase, partial [Variovorax sp.]|nr:CoA transferase [Variovorax sp.]